MPRVPTYDNFQATPSTVPQTQVSAPNAPDIAGAQRVGMKGIWLPRRARGREMSPTIDLVDPDLILETLSELPDHLR